MAWKRTERPVVAEFKIGKPGYNQAALINLLLKRAFQTAADKGVEPGPEKARNTSFGF